MNLRSPQSMKLLHALSRAAHGEDCNSTDAKKQSHRPVSPQTQKPQTRHAGLSRRSLLQGAAALGGASFLSRSRLGMASARSGQSVAIIGAGMAGLLSAYRLSQAGVEADIFEASQGIGGRISTTTGLFASGQYVERGGEWINNTHTHMLSLADELGVELKPYYWNSNEEASGLMWANGEVYSDLELVEDLKELSQIARVQTAQVRGQYTYDNANDAAIRIDNMGAKAWINDYVPGGESSKLGEWLTALMIIEMGAETNQISGMLPFWLASYLTIGLPLPGAGATLFTTRGGNQRLVEALAQRLAPEQFSYGHWLRAAKSLSDGRVELNFESDSGTSTLVYDRVILATPLNTLKNIELSGMALPELRYQLIDDLAMADNTKLQLQFSERAWYEQGSSGSVFGAVPFQSSYEPTVHQTGQPGILSNYLGGNAAVSVGSMSSSAAAQQFLGQIEEFLPGVSDYHTGLLTLDSWHHSPYQLGAYCNYAPGDVTRFYGYAHEAHGAMHFAGEYTSLDFWGYMEGAAESGTRAAQEVLSALGLI